MDTRKCDANTSDLRNAIDKIQEDIVDIKIDLSSINTTQSQISAILDKQEKNLNLHMARMAQNEFMIEELKQQSLDIVGTLQAIETERQRRIGAEDAERERQANTQKRIKIAGTIVGIIVGIVTILKTYGII